MVTGDANSDIASVHVVLTTPEKWDSITRKWTDNLYLIGSVKLLLIDEVHLLGDGSRGGCLETIICRFFIRVRKNAKHYGLRGKKNTEQCWIIYHCHYRFHPKA